MNEPDGAASVASESSHSWAWDEGSSGVVYQFCTRCGQDRDFLAPNEYHGWLPCEKRAQRAALVADYEREHGVITQAEMDALDEQPKASNPAPAAAAPSTVRDIPDGI